MRELILKALTSPGNNKRDFKIQETVEKDGILAKTQRRCLYFVIGKARIEDANNIEELAALKFADIPHRKRHYYILKIHDAQHHDDKLLFKVAGSFYAVCGNDIYCIAFVHSLKITFTASALNGEKG